MSDTPIDDTFGDAEPEDAWEATDPIPIQIDNLLLRLAILDQTGSRDGRDHRVALLDFIELSVLRRRAAGGLTVRAVLRIADMLEDIAFIRGRLG